MKEEKLSFIEESEIPFTVANDGLFSVPSGLGVLNLIGVAAIRDILRKGVLAVQYPGLNAFLGPIYPLLLVYSVCRGLVGSNLCTIACMIGGAVGPAMIAHFIW